VEAGTEESGTLPVTGPAAAPALLVGLLTTLAGLALLMVRRRPRGLHR
jgi:LPXTG-motif cell wall-anchored protein